MRFLPCPQHEKDLDKASTMHIKIAQKICIFFPRISHLSSNRREQNLAHLFPVYDPSKKAHPQHKIQAFLDAERHEFWERHDSSSLWAREMPKIKTQKDTNFRNAIILHYFWPENHQNPTTKDTNFGKLHSLTPAKMPTNKESIRFSRTSHHI